MATPELPSTGSPSWAAPGALISMCRERGLEGTFCLWAGAGCWARGDLGVLSLSHQRTGCQQGNRIPEVLSLKREGLHFLNDCLRKCDCGMWSSGRILDPTYFRVPTEGRDLAASPGKEKRVQEICGRGWDVVRSIWEARAQTEPP